MSPRSEATLIFPVDLFGDRDSSWCLDEVAAAAMRDGRLPRRNLLPESHEVDVDLATVVEDKRVREQIDDGFQKVR